jgi:hypothetical protein
MRFDFGHYGPFAASARSVFRALWSPTPGLQSLVQNYSVHDPHNFVWSGVLRLNGHDISAPPRKSIRYTALVWPCRTANNDGRSACQGISHSISTHADTVRFLSRRTSQVNNDIDGLPGVINRCLPFIARNIDSNQHYGMRKKVVDVNGMFVMR